MKRLAPLLLVLLGACSQKVDVTVVSAPPDWKENGWYLYGSSPIDVKCRPGRTVDYVELFIDSAIVGVDSYPDVFPAGYFYSFAWDVSQLPESSTHRVMARAIAGSHEYLSPEVLAKVGFRSRLVVDGVEKTFSVYRPDGKLEASFEPIEGAYPSYPRFRPGCHSVVFIADRKLYEAPWASNQAESLDAVANGIYSCDASPASNLVAFEGYPAATAHLFIKDGTGAKVQITHDGDIAYIDSSRFTCTANSGPVFSPDGGRLVYYRESQCMVPGDPHEGEMRRDAFVVDRYGTNPVNLTPGVDNAYFSGFTWTFDGKWVLFRVGTGSTPDGIVAANMSGHAITGLNIGAVAMACSPYDSTLAYVGRELEHRLYTLKLEWTDDTLYVAGPPMLLAADDYAQRSYIDWVKYSKQ